MTISARPLLLAFFTLALGTGSAVQAADPVKLRASLDTSATHGRTIAVEDYLKQVQAASGGRIQTELFHSGQLFKGANVAGARQGGIEIAAAPDADRPSADADIKSLIFYGRASTRAWRHRRPVGQPSARS